MTWWLWTACWGERADAHLIYALLAPFSATPEGLLEERLSVSTSTELIVRHGVVDGPAGEALLAQAQAGILDLSSVGTPMVPVLVKARRVTLECVLGDSAAQLDAYYSLPDPTALLCLRTELRPLLKALEDQLGLPFTERLASHLGNLDVVTFRNDPPEPPVAFSVERDPSRFVVRRRRPWSDRELWLHLQTKNGLETLSDELVLLPAGVETHEHPIVPEVVSYNVTLFPKEGGTRRLIDNATLITRIGVSGRALGRQVRLEDGLTRRLQGAPKDVRARAELRSDYAVFGSEASTSEQLIEHQAAKVTARLAAEAPDSPDRFFNRTLEDEVGVISHLNCLLDGGRVRRAVLVDPFFGDAALHRLLMRLESSGLDLTIVTSWTTTNPDTAEVLPGGPAVALETNTARLCQALENLSGYMAPRLSFRNLARGGDQAFHDRYLLLQPHQGEPQIYLLSNSINAMAANWPFSMSLMSGAAALQAIAYVEGLAVGEDVTGTAQISSTVVWPAT